MTPNLTSSDTLMERLRNANPVPEGGAMAINHSTGDARQLSYNRRRNAETLRRLRTGSSQAAEEDTASTRADIAILRAWLDESEADESVRATLDRLEGALVGGKRDAWMSDRPGDVDGATPMTETHSLTRATEDALARQYEDMLRDLMETLAGHDGAWMSKPRGTMWRHALEKVAVLRDKAEL